MTSRLAGQRRAEHHAPAMPAPVAQPAAYHAAGRLYRLAEVLTVVAWVGAVSAWLVCARVAYVNATALSVPLALGVAGLVAAGLVGALFVAAWGKTFALDVQRR